MVELTSNLNSHLSTSILILVQRGWLETVVVSPEMTFVGFIATLCYSLAHFSKVHMYCEKFRSTIKK